MNAVLVLPGQILILQENCYRRENGVFRYTDEIRPPVERQDIKGEPRGDDGLQIFIFDLRWLEDIRHQLQLIKRIRTRRVSERTPNGGSVLVQPLRLIGAVELLSQVRPAPGT